MFLTVHKKPVSSQYPDTDNSQGQAEWEKLSAGESTTKTEWDSATKIRKRKEDKIHFAFTQMRK